MKENTSGQEEYFKVNTLEETLKKAKARFLGSKSISESNKKLIVEFIRDKKLGHNGYGQSAPIMQDRENTLWSRYRILSELYGKEWKDLTVDDVKDLVERIDEMPVERLIKQKKENGGGYKKVIVSAHLKTTSIRDYRVDLKMLIRWLRKEENPKDLRFIPRGKSETKYHDQDVDVLTWDNCNLLSSKAENYRDKAIPWVLLDIPSRSREFVQVRVGDVKPLEYETENDEGKRQVIRAYKIFFRKGKTSFTRRTVTTTRSSAFLGAWLRMHPHRDNPNAPLWIDLGDWDKPLSQDGLARVLLRLKKRSGLTKPVNPHFWRHSSITYWGTKLPDQLLKKRSGLCAQSRVLENYSHIRDAEADEAALTAEGMRKVERIKEEGKVCKWCMHRNTQNEKFCVVCNSPLDLTHDELLASIEIRKYIDENVLKQALDGLREKLVKEVQGKTPA